MIETYFWWTNLRAKVTSIGLGTFGLKMATQSPPSLIYSGLTEVGSRSSSFDMVAPE